MTFVRSIGIAVLLLLVFSEARAESPAAQLSSILAGIQHFSADFLNIVERDILRPKGDS